MVKCPECKRIILDSTQDGGYKYVHEWFSLKMARPLLYVQPVKVLWKSL
jgi:hypothetical protein